MADFTVPKLVIKIMMKYIHGLDLGPVRCPVKNVPDELFEKIQKGLENMKFKDQCI